jgi:cytochrome b subunit of formate dehydrogenase
MRKASMHFVLDIVEGLILLFLVVSGFILWFALPEGSEAGKTLLYDRHTWIQIHQWLAVGLLIFFSTHVLTHWTWISFMIRSYLKGFKKG